MYKDYRPVCACGSDTPLHKAAVKCHMQVLDLLVHAGADVTIENNARHASALAGPSPRLAG